jgi:hypothetical protein
MFTSKDRALLLHSVVCMCVCYILRPTSVHYCTLPSQHAWEVGRRQSAVCQASHVSAAERKTWACLLKGRGLHRICLGRYEEGSQLFVWPLNCRQVREYIFASEGREKNISLISGL